MTKHPNDIYGELKEASSDAIPPPIPAATVLLLREQDSKLEVLMLHKTSKISFGGMWVFPGGKIDPGDYGDENDHDQAARTAAARETQEEAGIEIPQDKFIWFSHWTPPAITPKRFSTWFFVTSTDEDHEIQIDGGEIQNHQWISPEQALIDHKQEKIDLAPPTWVSLYHLSQFNSVESALTALTSSEKKIYETKIVQDAEGNRIALWAGDAGYEDADAENTEATHRLIMKKSGFEFEHTGVPY
jgi:8-oxo-dGTP pyrophosphatase MutT (NUDIX family)